VVGEGEVLQALGAPYLVLIDGTYTDLFTGRELAPKRLDADAWKRLVDTTHRVARLARERFGLRTVFHPHAETHVEYEDQIEAFLEQTDPALVALCFDTGHHAYRGGDPIAFMRKHHARIPYLHLKSVDPVKRDRVNAENIPFAAAVGDDLFVEPSQGAVDFLAFRDLLREIDYRGYAIVEQDMYPAPFDKPLPIAKRTRRYLRDIGIG
jgi:inosose dehydratase